MMFKKFVYRLLQMAFIPIVCGTIGMILLAGVFLLPTGRIILHTRPSASVLMDEQHYFSITPGYVGTRMDNYTEALYLSQAMVSASDAGLISAVLSGYEYQVPNYDGTTIQQLARVSENPEQKKLYDGSKRFFNGYMVFVKPLMILTTYAGIRQINLYAAGILFLLLAWCMYRKNLLHCVPAVAVSLLLIHPVTMALNMTFFGFYVCMIVPCIVMLAIRKQTLQDRAWALFGLTGALTYYFNMNYLQLLSFCVPLMFYYLILGTPEKTLKMLWEAAWFFAAWFIGWAGMMVFKWIVYILFLNWDILYALKENILDRASENEGSRWSAVTANVRIILENKWWIWLELSFIGLNIVSRIRAKDGSAFTASELSLVLIMVLAPILRYLIFPNHVLIHDYVMYRLMMIPVLALNLLLSKRKMVPASDAGFLKGGFL